MPWTSRRFLLGLGLLAGLAAAVPAGAVDATAPAPCTGILSTDPSGDQSLVGLQGLGNESNAANLDAVGLFFNHKPDKDGKPVLTANIQVANLDKSIPDVTTTQGGIYYYVIYSYGDAVKFVAAHNTGSEIAYEFGTIDPALGTYTTDGTTAGNFFEGPNGVVQIDVPEAVGGKPGETLKGAIVTIDGIDIGTDHGNGINNHADTLPDDADVLEPNGKDVTVAPCPGGGGGTTATPTTTTPAAPAPPASGGSQSPPPAQSTDTVLPIRFPNAIGSAKKAKKAKKLSFKAKASKPISNLSLTLKKLGGKGATLASGKVKSVKAGSVKVTLKVRKRLKKGAYTLIATGTVDGKKLQAGQKVAVKN